MPTREQKEALLEIPAGREILNEHNDWLRAQQAMIDEYLHEAPALEVHEPDDDGS